MSYQEVGSKAKTLYNQAYSKKYRMYDDLGIENHKHICNILKEISRSFKYKISVLDLGCGTGRYFHCLRNVERLVGIDISPDMLEEARNPVKKGDININKIDLIRANIFEIELPVQSFDFIYSIGVLGEHSPFDMYICNKLFDLIKPGGKLFFTVVDVSSKPKTLKRRVAEIVYPFLPPNWKKKVDDRWEFYMTDKELKKILDNCKFKQYEISRQVSSSPWWIGAHYECIVIKDAVSKPFKSKKQSNQKIK